MNEGKENFEDVATINDVYNLVETLASQSIKSIKSANKIVDGLYDYDVENGQIIEEALIKKATAQAYDKNAYSLAPHDPTVYARYFGEWRDKQFQTTVRRDDIRKVLANKGVGVEDVVAGIMDSLTQGESADDFKESRNLILNADVTNYRTICGYVPKNMRGVVYILRDMYNHLKSDNSDCTVETYESATPEEDIRIAVTSKVMNLIDVGELAHVFNLQKEEILGKMVIIDVDDLADTSLWYKCVVYDRKAMGRATFLNDYSQDVVGIGRYSNHYLTVSRQYLHNGLFKACSIDCIEACESQFADLMQAPTTKTITATLNNCTGTNDAVSVVYNEAYVNVISASNGYKLSDATIVLTMGGTDIAEDCAKYDATSKKITINIPHVTGNVVLTVTATSV